LGLTIYFNNKDTFVTQTACILAMPGH